MWALKKSLVKEYLQKNVHRLGWTHENETYLF